MPRLCTIAVSIAFAAALASSAAAQQPQPLGKPYKAIAIVPATDINDAEFTAMRAKLAEAAKARDRAALARMVADKNFFWQRDKADVSDKRKTGIEILTSALGLTNKEGVGWDMLATYADDPTAAPSPLRKGAVCSPAEPRYDAKALEALLKDTQTDLTAWGYPTSAGIDVRATPQASAPAIDKLALTIIRVMPETRQTNPAYIRILTPAGKTGFVTIDTIAPLGSDQLCYVKTTEGWKVGGYIGAGEPH